MGTVISERHLRRIESMIARKTSGSIVTGGTRMSGASPLDGHDFSKGAFFPPTIITDIDIEDLLWQEEIFGPVVVVKRFEVRQAALCKGGGDINTCHCTART